MTGEMVEVMLREGNCLDAHDIAVVHVASWQTTYRNIMPATFLDQLAVEPRERYWASLLCSDPRFDPLHIMIVAEEQGRVVGFATGGPERSGKYPYLGELYALYLLEAYQRQGIGRQLVTQVAQRLAQRDMKSMLVWVLTENPSREFYAHLGGEPVGSQLVTIGGESYEEIGYGWKDVSTMI
ncbi:MAG TPA: GNAT family N-acetyltransferase [Aggregatilineales bacterium]|nr:GNAT family N-acetyltransferase [Aggregatilineales bacterium]